MTCHHKPDSACPFAFTDQSEMVQNYGCLPEPLEIVTMREKHGRTWACHENPEKPCAGAIAYLKKEGKPHTVTHPLVTEQDNWSPLCR